LHHKKVVHLKPRNEVHRSHIDGSVEKALVENFVSLQKVMTHLSANFDNLANQISKLLNLFEISAKVLAEKDSSFGKESKDSKKIVEKLDNLLEQNKLIARGLTLVHEKFPNQGSPQNFENFGTQVPTPRRQTGESEDEGYQSSISSREIMKPSFDVDDNRDM